MPRDGATTTGEADLHAKASPRRRLDDLFRAQAVRSGTDVAIVHRGSSMRYDELDARSDRIAHYLLRMGVRTGMLVGVCLERSPDLVAAILGVLKAGAAYLPLDPAYPPARLAFMLRDSQAPILISRRGTCPDFPYSGRLCDLDRDAGLIEGGPAVAPHHDGRTEDLAYVIYTSGSSGRPKGVRLAHSAVHLIDWAQATFSSADIARMAATTSVCFDPSIIEIFVPLCTGGSLILKDDALEPFGPDERPTMLNGPPSVIATLLHAAAIPVGVRVINIGGEALSADLVNALYEQTDVERIYNHYGPTEATTCTTVALLPRGLAGAPPIGRPIAGARVHVLDADSRPVQTEEVGEICIAGPSVALGYVDAIDRDAAAFSPDPFVPSDRMYRTGDLGRWTESGDLAFVGRLGDQVKINGFRIEPGEVEAALLHLPEVHQAAVIVRTVLSRQSLVAFVVGEGLGPSAEIRRGLAQSLPAHALPGQIRILASMPLAPGGKIDRLVLRDLAELREPGPTTWLPPIEEAISSILQSYLGVMHVGLDDDFFEMGGDSLRAVSAAAQIEAILARPVSAALVAHHPTPRRLAAALRDAPPKETDILLPLNGVKEGTPLLCLPDFHGRPISFMSLANVLDRPVYGLSPQPIRAAIIANPDLALLTSAFCAAVRREWPAGPYHIAGFSMGSTLAVDLARALEADGVEVKLLLIDGPNEVYRPSLRHTVRWAAREVGGMIRPGRLLMGARTVYRSRFLFSRWALPNRRISNRDIPPYVAPGDRELARAIVQAVVSHRPNPFFGQVCVIRCGRRGPRTSLLDGDGLLGWRDCLKGPVTQTTVAGEHHEIMREPLVVGVARALG